MSDENVVTTGSQELNPCISPKSNDSVLTVNFIEYNYITMRIDCMFFSMASVHPPNYYVTVLSCYL